MEHAATPLTAALLAAIGVLWAYIQSSIKDLKRRTDECEADRDEIHGRLDAHSRQLAVFRACPADPCPAREGLERAESFSLSPDTKP